LDNFEALAETSLLGKRKFPPRTCPDGEGYWVEYEAGFVLFHPDLGAFPMPGAFASAWKSLQASELPLGYPVGRPEIVPQQSLEWWQEFENGVLFGNPGSEVRPLAPLPIQGGSLSQETITQIACDWLHRILSQNPGCHITQNPECTSLLDFQRREEQVTPRGHTFQFEAEYHSALLPDLSISVECGIRWKVEPGSHAIQAWLDDYQYRVVASRGLSWMLPQSTLDQKVEELVSPWLRRPQEVVLTESRLLCVKVFPDGDLYSFPVPGR
jgi:LGFP repeat